MSSDIAISVENVSKAYRIWNDPSARLKGPFLETAAELLPHDTGIRQKLAAKARSYHRDFYALRDISFQVHRGESVGIIGRNGSGKSTLLQIIAGTLRPTTGSVKVNGRIAALLELGSGFNPDFTGRENVYLNAAVLGLTRAEIDSRFDQIAAFADIGDFLEEPVKTYSSGMMMRLAFAVQTAVDAGILIIDEALAVGDVAFVAKCINRVSSFIRDGNTLLFVSHDTGLVKQITSRAVFLEKGTQVAVGDTNSTVLAYANSIACENSAHVQPSPDRFARDDAPYSFTSIELWPHGRNEPGDTIEWGQRVVFALEMAAGPATPARLVFSIYSYMGIIVCSGIYELPEAKAGQSRLRVLLDLPKVRLSPGPYRVNFSVRSGIEIVAWARNALHFTVAGGNEETYVYREDVEPTLTFS